MFVILSLEERATIVVEGFTDLDVYKNLKDAINKKRLFPKHGFDLNWEVLSINHLCQLPTT